MYPNRYGLVKKYRLTYPYRYGYTTHMTNTMNREFETSIVDAQVPRRFFGDFSQCAAGYGGQALSLMEHASEDLDGIRLEARVAFRFAALALSR